MANKVIKSFEKIKPGNLDNIRENELKNHYGKLQEEYETAIQFEVFGQEKERMELTLGYKCTENYLNFEKFPNLKIFILKNFSYLESMNSIKNIGPCLNEFYINYCNVKKIQNISTLVNLKTLDLGFNEISKIENLDTLQNLSELDCRNNKISSICGIEQLIHLRTLNLSYNCIEKMDNLSTLTELSTIDLKHNKIKKIQGTDNLINLQYMFLEHNEIKEINGLSEQSKLLKLDLSFNRIEKIKNLESLIELRELNLSNNFIKRLENIEDMVKLEYLDLSYNKIMKVKRIENNISMKELKLEHNKIERLPIDFKLGKCESWLDLYVSWYQIAELADEKIKSKYKARVNVYDNPICREGDLEEEQNKIMCGGNWTMQ